MARHDVSSETREGGVHRNGKEKELLYLDTNIPNDNIAMRVRAYRERYELPDYGGKGGGGL